MKTFSLPLLFLGIVLITATPRMALADDGTASTPTTPADGTTNSAPSCHKGHFLKQAFAQLDLTDVQKDQIKQIHEAVTDPKQRREQTMNVLTPDQQAKLKQLFQERKNKEAAASDATSGTN